MKKKIYLLILVFATLVITQSCCLTQKLNLMAGVGLNKIVGESDSWKSLIGPQAGIIYPVANFGEFLSFRSELNVSMQGAKYEESSTYMESLKGRVNMWYANAPQVIRYQTKSGFYGEAGVQPSLLLSAKDKYSGTTNNYYDQLKKFDFGIPFGVGYESKYNFGLGLRVIPGLTNINKEGTAKDRNFLVALRGTYNFGKK